MDAKVDDWVVTPRIPASAGTKLAKVNALWYNALCVMAEFAQVLADADGQRCPDRTHFDVFCDSN
jgi:glycogen debranching enzyme